MDIAATPPSTYNLECPISIKWTISEEKLTALKDSATNEYLDTEWFEILSLPGVEYYLDIFPNGNREELRGKVLVFLNLQLGNETKIKADVKYTVESAGFSHNLSHEYEEGKGRGIEICSTSEFFDPEKRFISDGKLTLKCEGILSVEREKLAGNQNGMNLDSESVGPKLWKKNNKDFNIKVSENSVKAHKYVLAAQSPVFEAMFELSMKETTENQMDITDFSFKVVETAVQLCYNVATFDALNLKDKSEVLQFFDKYDMDSLKL